MSAPFLAYQHLGTAEENQKLVIMDRSMVAIGMSDAIFHSFKPTKQTYKQWCIDYFSKYKWMKRLCQGVHNIERFSDFIDYHEGFKEYFEEIFKDLDRDYEEIDLLDFDDEISKYIPEATFLKVALDRSKGIDSPTEKIKTPITIGQLLSHSSGLSHGLWNNKLDRDIGKLIYGVNYPFFTDYSLHKTVESRAKALLSAPLMFQPGTDWYYSAGGDLLAVIIEKVTKQTVSSYLKENIFNPLGMNDTSYNVDKEDLERVMQLHYTNNNKKKTNDSKKIHNNNNHHNNNNNNNK